jgi:hypothetical protein
MTICIECVYHKCTHEGSTEVGPPRNTWFYQICTNKNVQKPRYRDFVTGDIVTPVTTFCRDINTHGNCPYYEAIAS